MSDIGYEKFILWHDLLNHCGWNILLVFSFNWNVKTFLKDLSFMIIDERPN